MAEKLEKIEKAVDEKLTVAEMYANRPRKWWVYTLVVLIIAALVGWSGSTVQFEGLTVTGRSVAQGVISGITHPDLKLMFGTSNTDVPYLLLQTMAIAVLGTIFGAILAIPFAFLASTNILPKPLAYLFRVVILLIRTIPSLVWALMWIRVTGPGAACGVITQSVCSIGMISKMYITAIEDLDTHILESLDAMGCNAFQKIRYGVIPQLTASFISTTIYRFDINLKDATTLGIVGAGGIGASLVQCLNSRRWAMVGSFVWGLMILVLIIEFISTRVRKKLARGQEFRTGIPYQYSVSTENRWPLYSGGAGFLMRIIKNGKETHDLLHQRYPRVFRPGRLRRGRPGPDGPCQLRGKLRAGREQPHHRRRRRPAGQPLHLLAAAARFRQRSVCSRQAHEPRRLSVCHPGEP